MRDYKCAVNTEKIERMQKTLDGLSGRIQEIHESIVGNGHEGLKLKVDRNTNFRKFQSKLFWSMIIPLYLGLLTLSLKTLFTGH